MDLEKDNKISFIQLSIIVMINGTEVISTNFVSSDLTIYHFIVLLYLVLNEHCIQLEICHFLTFFIF